MVNTIYLFILLMTMLNIKNVHMQLTLVCAYDNNIYSSDTTVTVSETVDGVCKESYAYNKDTSKTIVLTFTNVVIDCTNTNNNIRIVGQDTSTTYCGTYSTNTFTYTTSSSSFLAIQRFGVVSFNLKIEFVTDYSLCNPNPCQNSGACTISGTSYTCTCTTGFSGTNCQTVIPQPPDIACSYDNNVYTVDASAAITETTSGCKESYAFNNEDTSKNIRLKLTNIVIDCSNSNNNIRLVSSATTSTYCGNSNTNTFEFTTASDTTYVAIQKFGTVAFNLQVQIVTGEITACNPNPCQNSGTCSVSGTSYTCTCTSAYGGTNCENVVPEAPSIACSYDNNIYLSDSTVSISETTNNLCKESYAYKLDTTKTIELTFTNIVIDCTNINNNLKLVEQSSSVTYCGRYSSNTFTYTSSTSNFVAIERFGVISFNLQIKFQ